MTCEITGDVVTFRAVRHKTVAVNNQRVVAGRIIRVPHAGCELTRSGSRVVAVGGRRPRGIGKHKIGLTDRVWARGQPAGTCGIRGRSLRLCRYIDNRKAEVDHRSETGNTEQNFLNHRIHPFFLPARFPASLSPRRESMRLRATRTRGEHCQSAVLTLSLRVWVCQIATHQTQHDQRLIEESSK